MPDVRSSRHYYLYEKAINWLSNAFQYFANNVWTHLASNPDKTNHQSHLQTTWPRSALYLKSKMTVECCSQVCGRQGFCWVELHSDKRAWQSQDYSVCWEDWNIMSSEIYCMFSPDLFVSAPPAAVHAPCFQVSQNGKHLAWKTLWYLNISLIQFQAFSTDLMKSPFWVFFMFFFFFFHFVATEHEWKRNIKRQSYPI